MALKKIANGQVSDASQVDQLIDVLTGVMTDQPVAVANSLVAQSITVKASGPYAALLADGVTPTPAGWDYASQVVTQKDPWHAKAWGVKSDGQFVSDGTMNGTTAVLTSVTGLFAAGDVGKLCLVPGAGAAGALLTTTIASYQSATQVTLAAVSQTAVSTAYVTWGTEDTAAWIALYTAAPSGAKIIIPWGYSLYRGSFMGGITKSLALEGLGIFEVFQASDWGTSAPTISPYLRGSVIVQCQAAQNGIDITGTAITVHRRQFGIKFADGIKFQNTGHGLLSSPSASDGAGGHTVGEWSSEDITMMVFGHDGNHYGQWTRNSLNTTRIHFHSYGGGVIHDECDSGNTWTGNCVDISSYGELFVSGTANGYDLAGRLITRPLNLMTFIRPQVNAIDLHTAYPGATFTTPTVAQYLCKVTHGNIALVRFIDPDFEPNIAGVANPVDFGAITDSVAVTTGASSLPATGITYPYVTHPGQEIFKDVIYGAATDNYFGSGAAAPGTGAFVDVGTLGTGDGWIDVKSTTANANLQLRAKGVGVIVLNKAMATKRTSLAYSTSIVTDASLGNQFDTSISDGVAFTITNPTNSIDGTYLAYTIRNSSGGAAGVLTWDTQFKLSTWTQPANGFSRSITFKWNGANWVEHSRTPADVPN